MPRVELTCTKCGERKATSEFPKQRSSKSGFNSWCKVCKNTYARDTARDYWLQKTYGITEAQYDQMLAEQRGVCAICEKACTTGQRLSVDHDHDTGKVRGLLCRRCNSAIGHMNDDPILLQKAVKYLGTS